MRTVTELDRDGVGDENTPSSGVSVGMTSEHREVAENIHESIGLTVPTQIQSVSETTRTVALFCEYDIPMEEIKATVEREIKVKIQTAMRPPNKSRRGVNTNVCTG